MPLLASWKCEHSYIESYDCKDCNFKTDLSILFKQHVKNYHGRRKQNHEVTIKSYICGKCSFETYFAMKWFQHTIRCMKNKENRELTNCPYHLNKQNFK